MNKRKLRSFRLDPDILERLDRRAQQAGLSVTALVERYIDEGLRQDDHPGILFVDGAAGRRARVAGTGLEVWEVIATVHDNGGSTTQAASYLDIPERYVLAATHYYADYTYEIDAWIAGNDRLYEEELQRQRRVADAIG
jgi:uncharacterized protein (DUF433 family)